ncbi:CocE/NonD family hydrolase [Solimonas sp. K1W22B-7]|uniref:CocE/NonD family hydrolase n=1 Tax=Solimonas sp. K1W22B-7 TaxID=2303331 RepID=UPI000E3313F3|nr:CocE/NonD family hydrolase [Solimonas sp. K1W22B-7]AXQ28577.1 CocE/NonD family hydrolase [Solimonas sp. K1W22B-7]
MFAIRMLLPLLFLTQAALAAPSDLVLRDEPLQGITRELGYAPGSEGQRLAYVAYRPAAKGRYPTVLWFDVYGGGALPPRTIVESWVRAGYAVVGASVRGTGCSEGRFEPFNLPHDARDGAALVEWAAAQGWSSGKVGLLGNSQPGILQYGIASLAPPHLAAIAPGGSIARLFDDGWYPGGLFNAAFAAGWSTRDQPGASAFYAAERIRLGDEACKATAAKIGPNGLFERVRALPVDDEFYRWSSPWERAPSIKVPTLMVQSWTDPALGSSALWNFERLGARHKRLFVLNGGHEAYEYSTAQAEVLRWMDRWLKGERNGVEREPRVRVDFDTRISGTEGYAAPVPAKTGWTRTLSDWPAPQTQWQRWFLRGDGRMDKEAPAQGEGSAPRRYFYPSGTEFPIDNPQFSTAANPWASLRYRSPAMAQDSAILGAPQLRFHASSDQADTDFVVMLSDVAPNGDVTYLQRGYLRASRRAVDPGRSTPQRVFHPHDRSEPLVPGQVYEFRMSIPPVAHVARAGHAIELLVMAPNPVQTPGWGLIGLPLPGFNTFYHSREQPFELSLPVVPGIVAEGLPPPCGSLPYQPCRAAARKDDRP